MNFNKKPLVFLALAFLLMPAYSFAQFQLNNTTPFLHALTDLKRYELGFTYIMPAGEFNGVTRVTRPDPHFIGDTTMKRKLTGLTGYGMSIGVSAPFKRTGHISCWAMDVQLLLNYYTWMNLNPTRSDLDGSFTDPVAGDEVNAVSYQVALPLGVEYKIGCDAAVLSKRLKLCATFGGGVIPQMWMTNLTNVSTYDNQFSFGLTPYAKVEAGFFAGWCMKLRLMYTYGHINLFDANKSIPSVTGNQYPATDGPFGFASTSNFMVSLILMPFSGKWPETQWYNTYDTYQPYEKLN